MKAAFHYIVKAKLIRFIKDGEINFIEFNEKFENSNPIIAREDAFKYYQNYIDVLLEGKGKKYYNDRETRKNLSSFIDPGTIVTTPIRNALRDTAHSPTVVGNANKTLKLTNNLPKKIQFSLPLKIL